MNSTGRQLLRNAPLTSQKLYIFGGGRLLTCMLPAGPLTSVEENNIHQGFNLKQLSYPVWKSMEFDLSNFQVWISVENRIEFEKYVCF